MPGCIGIISRATVTECDVQISVWTKLNRTAVVVLEWLLDIEDDFLGIGIGDIWIGFGEPISGDDRAVIFLLGIADKKFAVRFKLGVECKTEQALFVCTVIAPLRHFLLDVEKTF